MTLSSGNANCAFNFLDRAEYQGAFQPQTISGAGAAGGFLLYPNKPNNNSTVIVYHK